MQGSSRFVFVPVILSTTTFPPNAGLNTLNLTMPARSKPSAAPEDAAAPWAMAVKAKCGSRGVSSPESVEVLQYGSLQSMVDTGASSPLLHATVRQMPLDAEESTPLSDAVISLFHRSPALQGVVIAPPALASQRLLDHLNDSLPPNTKGPRQQVYVRGDPLLCSGDDTKGYRCHTHNAVAIRRAHFEDAAPVYSLHSREKYIWASDVAGVTTPERHTAANPALSVVLPGSAEAIIGTEDGRIEVPATAPINTDLSALSASHHVLLSDALSAEEVQHLATMATHPAHQGKYGVLFTEPAWGGRRQDTLDRAQWYPKGTVAGTDAAKATVLRIRKSIEEATGTTLRSQNWGFIRVRKFTPGHTVTPRQSWHRDIDRAVYPEDKGAFSILAPLTMDIPVDGREGQFVAHSRYGIPDPWMPCPMDCTRGQAWVFDSRLIHRGGTVPAEATADRIMFFISLSELPYNYSMNVPIREPSWAAPPPIHYSDPAPGAQSSQQPRPDPLNPDHAHHFEDTTTTTTTTTTSSSSSSSSSSALDSPSKCTRSHAARATSSTDPSPAATSSTDPLPAATSSTNPLPAAPILCGCCAGPDPVFPCIRHHCRRMICQACSTHDICRRCDIPHPPPAARDAPEALRTGTTGTCIPTAHVGFATDPYTHLALWVQDAAGPGPDTIDTPTYLTCPLRSYHWLPFPEELDQANILYVGPGQIAAARSVVGAVAWVEGPGDKPPACVWRWLMVPRHARPIDPSMLVHPTWASWYQPGEKDKEEDKELWCACQQV
jgi:hypothetical protein